MTDRDDRKETDPKDEASGRDSAPSDPPRAEEKSASPRVEEKSASPRKEGEGEASSEGKSAEQLRAVRARELHASDPAEDVARRRVWTYGVAGAAVIAALFLGRSWGLYDARQGARGAGSSSSAAADPAADEMNAGIAATDANEAVGHFRKVLELNPNHYGATYQLARALDRAGLRDEATRQWERVYRVAEQQGDPALVETARLRLAQAGGAPDGPARPAGDAMAQGIEALYKKRDPAIAIARFREVLAQTPEHYGATFQLASAYDLAGDIRSSRPLWEKMAAMADASGDQKTADAARGRLAEIDKTLGPPASSADPDAEAMRTAVDALYAKKDPEAAIPLFRAILKRNPTHYGALYQLATALDQAKKPAEARPLWEKVLKMAEAMPDEKTVAAARARLSQKP